MVGSNDCYDLHYPDFINAKFTIIIFIISIFQILFLTLNFIRFFILNISVILHDFQFISNLLLYTF
jgi:hypothetical protein